MNTVSFERKDAKAAGSRSAMVLANAISVRRTSSFNPAWVAARAGAVSRNSDANNIHRDMSGLYLHCVIMLPTGHESSCVGIQEGDISMAGNRGVAYMGPGKV